MPQLYDVHDRVNGELTNHVLSLYYLNDANTDGIEMRENQWNTERARDVRQDRDVARLYSAVVDFKDKLFQVTSRFSPFPTDR